MQIIERYLKFLHEDFNENRELFEKLKDKQNPHTLFIGCSDSRVIPELITKSLPGELFVVRNVANIVPPYHMVDLSVPVAAAIEYSVLTLEVKNIIICGHSNCGGCSALHLSEEELSNRPNVRKWISISKDIANEVSKIETDLTKRYRLTEQLNIIRQIENLLTYPFVKEKFDRGEIKIYGWYFEIPTGKVYNYNRVKINFEPIESF